MRFDWYQATVPAHPIELVEALRADLDPRADIESSRGRHNYHQSFTIKSKSGERLACVLAGGPNGHPNVTASGDITPDFVSAIRARWEEHNVTRFDAAADFCGEGAYEGLQAVCKEVAGVHKVKGRAIVPDDIAEGRTYYLGAPTSDVRVRLYEKTAQLRNSLPSHRHAEVPDGWSRLEIQVRPKGIVRSFSSKLNPEDIWGFSAWTKDLAEKALDLRVQRIKARIAKESDNDRAFRFMVQQYSKVLKAMRDDLGDWQSVGLQIGQEIKNIG